MSRAIESDGEFVVLKGSTARKDGSPSWISYKELRDELFHAGKLRLSADPEFLEFAEDVPFRSPSASGGGRRRGKSEWSCDVASGRNWRNLRSVAGIAAAIGRWRRRYVGSCSQLIPFGTPQERAPRTRSHHRAGNPGTAIFDGEKPEQRSSTWIVAWLRADDETTTKAKGKGEIRRRLQNENCKMKNGRGRVGFGLGHAGTMAMRVARPRKRKRRGKAERGVLGAMRDERSPGVGRGRAIKNGTGGASGTRRLGP